MNVLDGTMTSRWLASFAVAFTGLVGPDLLACGDKFLVPSRGLRFELAPSARQQAAVLLYVSPSSPLANLFDRLSIDPALRKAGYRPTVAASLEELDRALGQGNWDVVLVDLGSGLAARRSTAGSPAVLAVAVNATNRELAQAKPRYDAIIKSPKQSRTFIDTFDAAVASRQAARAKAAKKSS
jgi:hypothetical protein